MTLPTFVVIGAMKAGTVSLRHYLDDHPAVFMADGEKFGEPNFFVAEDNWPRGVGWYEIAVDPAAADLDQRRHDHRSLDKPVPRLHDLHWLPRRQVKLDPRWRPDQRTGLARLVTTRHARAGDSAIPPELRGRLAERLAQDLDRFEHLLGHPIPESWGWSTSASA